MMRLLVPCLFCACLVVLAVAPAAADAEDCAICHEDVATAFQRTGHAIAPGWDPATGCEACHGPGDKHIEAGGDPELIIRPQLLSRRESSDLCLSCHRRQESHFAAGLSMHRLADVGCLDCHNPHLATEHMLVRENLELCSGCHQGVAGRFELPRAHPLGERGGPACMECHDPHATRSLRAPATAVETCEKCHFEKVGPFVYEHGDLRLEGCSSCHTVHGSTNRHLLTHDVQVNLCYECHNANFTPGWHSARRFVHQKCTACHAAIHGSNTNQFFLEE